MNRETITRFVRNTLGCTCPDAVFERIEFAPAHGGSPLRLMIGDRLQIRIVRVAASDQDLARRVGAWLAQGIGERDALGYSRFRLVLATDDPGNVEYVAQAALGQLPVPDQRAHVHVLSNAQVDGALNGAGVGWSR